MDLKIAMCTRIYLKIFQSIPIQMKHPDLHVPPRHCSGGQEPEDSSVIDVERLSDSSNIGKKKYEKLFFS